MKPNNQHKSYVGIHEFFLDKELLLFSDLNGNLYRLNTSAAFIWCHQAEGFSTQEIIHAMVDTFGISAEKAQSDVRASLSEWRHLGLLYDHNTVPATENFLPRMENSKPAGVGHHPQRLTLTHAYKHCYRFGSVCFQVRFANLETKQIVHPIIAHLEIASNTPCNSVFDITKESEGYLLSRNFIPLATCQDLREVGPLVHGELLVTACKSSECLAIIHAAAMAKGNYAILFPGDSGSGKSTLAAGMIAAGYRYLSDEIVLLTSHPYHVLPISLSIGLKEGAWPVLSPFHPIIEKLPIYHRQDGKKIRYLAPHDISNQVTISYPVRQIIFPCYIAGITTYVQPIGRAEALNRIAEGGYDVNSRLNSTTISELVNWISNIECWELRYSSLPEAINHIQKLT
ncbi:PqqD family peptide modification chaperone [Nitrosococcus wardiae]|uniref:PqqD family peptide modification chaperone n=1 Tax=Nitrosococcus wardiae TaxID=1814290 RepID=A0A4P7C0R5_9GAMM|nr:PqqD family peptide modification chaperone [Nitrosococcus wardiae]QBQ54432.1 PqqD family peptide modification chaperone [Nitrosococcus wardiae]